MITIIGADGTLYGEGRTEAAAIANAAKVVREAGAGHYPNGWEEALALLEAGLLPDGWTAND